jgi:cytochrome c553
VRTLLFGPALILAATLSGSGATLQEQIESCLACHGEDGTSPKPQVPSLGAQQADYILIQLYMFRDKLRQNEIMNETAKPLSDEDLRSFSDEIAKLPSPKVAVDAADQSRLERGRMLLQTQRCNFCHGANFEGRNNVPRVAGQREDYLVKTLREYKANARPGYDASMAEVLARVGDDDIRDLAYVLARLQ